MLETFHLSDVFSTGLNRKKNGSREFVQLQNHPSRLQGLQLAGLQLSGVAQ